MKLNDIEAAANLKSERHRLITALEKVRGNPKTPAGVRQGYVIAAYDSEGDLYNAGALPNDIVEQVFGRRLVEVEHNLMALGITL